MIVGRVPFKVWSELDLHVILEQEVNVPYYIDASKELKDFVMKCLVKDQKERVSLREIRFHEFFYSLKENWNI